jgi:hypothetical protein
LYANVIMCGGAFTPRVVCHSGTCAVCRVLFTRGDEFVRCNARLHRDCDVNMHLSCLTGDENVVISVDGIDLPRAFDCPFCDVPLHVIRVAEATGGATCDTAFHQT